jgi:hypothetical protein
LFFHKKQQKALDSYVKALIKEKKEKENVFRKKITKAKKEKLLEERKEYQRNLQHM